jgi:hypothetical protein
VLDGAARLRVLAGRQHGGRDAAGGDDDDRQRER